MDPKWKTVVRGRLDPLFVSGVIGACIVVVLWRNIDFDGSSRGGMLEIERIQAHVSSSSLAWSAGSVDSRASVVELIDLGCPVCAVAHEANWRWLKAQVDAGKVHYVSYPFPLPNHPNAVDAALVAHCAGRQGTSFHWGAKDHLYSSQSRWSQEYPVLELLIAALTPLGLDQPDLRHCISDIGVSYRSEIVSSRLRLIYAGVDRTPFLLVNGEMVSWDNLRSHVEGLLTSPD